MSLFNMGDKAYVMLADGRIFEGYSLGAKGTAVGEIVFTTGMTGYQETLSEPNYYGQIVIQTFPLIGNYGVNDEDYESDSVAVNGYIVREWCNAPSNFRMQGNLDDFLKKHNVVGIHSIDTRCLTKIIREEGVMNGVITTENVYEKKDELLKLINEFTVKDAVKTMGAKENKEIKTENGKYSIAFFDFGSRRSLIDRFTEKGCNVTVVSPYTTAEEISAIAPDGIVFSEGPGDPAENGEIVENIKKIQTLGIPMYGISLGHQLVALANGGKTEKLKYGHRGANQPVLDHAIGRTFVTTQNHGYVVAENSIPSDIAEVTHINGNDKTCEGLAYKNIPCITTQFAPEICGGPLDTTYIIDKFIEMINTKEGK